MEQVNTLLPLSDRFAMIAGEGNTVHGFFARDKVEQAAGSLLEKTDHDPPRYRVKRFPAEEQIAQMGPDLGE